MIEFGVCKRKYYFCVEIGKKGVMRCSITKRKPVLSGVRSRKADEIAGKLADAFFGKNVKFGCRVDMHKLSEFERKVLGETRKIPFGKTASYGEIARRIGNPRAARAVGNALGKNPVCIIIPCHRVIRSVRGGACPSAVVGNFWLGVALKKEMLKNEGVKF